MLVVDRLRVVRFLAHYYQSATVTLLCHVHSMGSFCPVKCVMRSLLQFYMFHILIKIYTFIVSKVYILHQRGYHSKETIAVSLIA